MTDKKIHPLIIALHREMPEIDASLLGMSLLGIGCRLPMDAVSDYRDYGVLSALLCSKQHPDCADVPRGVYMAWVADHKFFRHPE